MMTPGRLFVGAYLLCAVPAAAQADPRLEAVPPSARLVVRAELDSARAAGLPTEPLVLRALEGTHRGVPPERIAAAVRSLRLRFAAARPVLGGSPTGDEYVAAAAVLGAGVAPAVVGDFRRERPQGSVAVPLVVVGDLAARGVPGDLAGRTVLDLVARGADDRTLLNLRTAVHEDLARGGAPRGALETRARGILAALPPLRPAAVTTTVPAGP